MAHRFAIGTTYTTRTKSRTDVNRVEDQLTVTNSRGEVVREFYITSHQFGGQRVRCYDVCDTTIARNNPQPPVCKHCGFTLDNHALASTMCMANPDADLLDRVLLTTTFEAS